MGIEESRPWVSSNCRVAPEDVQRANEDLKRHGVVNAYFDSSGRAVAHSRQGRNGLLKYTNTFDRDAGYSDYSGK